MGKQKIRTAVFLCSVILGFMGVLFISGDTFAAVTESGLRYDPNIRMKVYTEKRIFIDGFDLEKYDTAHVDFRMEEISSNSHSLKFKRMGKKAYCDRDSILVYANKRGGYIVTITVKIKETQKKEKIKIGITVGEANPIQSISLDGKILEKESGDALMYLSEKSSGKMKIMPNPGYEVKGILVCGSDRDGERDMSGNYAPHYHFGGKQQTVKNGGKVQLNHEAKGVTSRIDVKDDGKPVGEEYSPYYLSEEEYDLTMAATKLYIYYKVDGSDTEQFIEITVYTPVGK